MGAYGRHVVVSFDDVADAEAFIAAVGVEGAVFFMGSDTHFKNIDISATRVSGIFAKPNDFCQCSWSDGEKTYVRGTKYGLYVHDKCAKPEGGHLQTVPHNLLYPKGLSAKERVDMEGYISLTSREGKRNWPVPQHEKEA